MKVLVLGAGAVGSYYGGRLAQSGHHVTLVGRRAHVAAIRNSGLIIDSKITGRQVVQLNASEDVESCEAPDLVLITVKSYDTQKAAESLRGRIRPATTVLSLQNGIDNHEIAARALGNYAVFPTVIYVGVRVPEPGVVEHVTRGEITLPEKAASFVQTFRNAGILTNTSGDILGLVWKKLLLNASCNALGMIAGASFGALAANPSAREVIAAAVNEVVRVAAAKEIRLPADSVEQVFKTAESLGPGLSSMLQDYRAGKRTEIEALNGVIVTLGKAFGIPTPCNAILYAAVKLMEGARSEDTVMERSRLR